MNSQILSLEEKIKNLPDDPQRLPEKIDLLNELAWEIALIRTRRALAFAKESYRLSKRHDYLRGRAYAARNISYCYLVLSRLERALQFSREALEIFITLEEQIGEATTMDTQAMIFWRLGNYERALELSFQALQLTRDIDFRQGEGWALHNIGTIYHEIEEFDQAVQYFNQSLQVFREIDYRAGIARVLTGLGEVYYRSGDLKKSLQLHREALELMRQQQITIGVNRGLVMLGILHQEMGQMAEAREYLEQSVKICEELGSAEASAVTFLELGKLEQKLGHSSESLRMLVKALSYAERSQATPTLYRVHQALAEVHESLDDTSKALFHFKRFHKLYQAVHGQESATKIKNLQTRMEVERAEKEAEIHRLKYVELAQMQARLIQSEKMAMVGRLVAGIAHEVNTPLGVILSNSQLAEKRLKKLENELGNPTRKEGAPAKTVIKAVQLLLGNSEMTGAAARNISEIVERLKRFSNLDQSEWQRYDLQQHLDDILGLLKPRLGENIRVHRKLGKVPEFYANGAELNQVFMTLLVNAIEAVGDSGDITIGTAVEEGQVRIEIADNGRGIPPEKLESIFEIGLNRKQEQVRMTVGLANSYNIIQAHKGSIAVDSTPGEGTTFTIRLPRQLP